jgi:hypothetical protein
MALVFLLVASDVNFAGKNLMLTLTRQQLAK